MQNYVFLSFSFGFKKYFLYMGNLQHYINKKHFFLKKIMGVISFLKQSQNKQKFKNNNKKQP